MNVELSVIVNPTDQGVKVMSTCNDGYKKMVDRLRMLQDSGVISDWTIPRARQGSLLFYPDGEIDCSVLAFVAQQTHAVLLYRQPYSAKSLEDVVQTFKNKYEVMKQRYKTNTGVEIEEN